jgi:hypothetical protein
MLDREYDMYGRIIALLAVAALGSAVHAGEILSCVSPQGHVMYTNLSCPPNTQAHHVADYQPVPDSPPPSPAESAAQEAAINSRLALEAAQRAEAAAYARQAPAYPESEPGGPYRQSPDYNMYTPAFFGGGFGFGFNNGFGFGKNRGFRHPIVVKVFPPGKGKPGIPSHPMAPGGPSHGGGGHR